MAKKVGKYKLSKQEYQYLKLEQEGGEIGGSLNIGGDTSIEGDIDVLNTISSSGGSLLVPNDLSFQIQDGDDTIDVMSTQGMGSTLGIHNNLLYSDGINIGIGTTEPKAKFQVGIEGGNSEFRVAGDISGSNNVKFSGLPTSNTGLSTGQLYTQLGSELGLGGITGSIANNKFVFIK